VDAIADLNRQLQDIANDSSLDPSDRTAALTDLRERINDVVGEADRMISMGHRAREAETSAQMRSRMAAREVADVREALVEEFAPAQLDEAAVVSHDELDAFQEEGLLDEAALAIDRETSAHE
jgi:hypothetical protein